MEPQSIIDVNDNLQYENDKQQPIINHAFARSYTTGFVFLNKYFAITKASLRWKRWHHLKASK